MNPQTAWNAALDWVQQSAISAITTRVLPLITGWTVLNVALIWLQDKLGIDLPKEAIDGWLIAAVAGGVGKGIAYVKNLGEGQKHLLSQLLDLIASGRNLLDGEQGPTPVVPPGLGGGE